MKYQKFVSVVLAAALLWSGVSPAVTLAKSAESVPTPLQQTVKDFNVSADLVQQGLNKGYTLEEVRSALAQAKKGKKYEEALRESAPRPVSDHGRSKADAKVNVQVTEKVKKDAEARLAAAAAEVSADATDTSIPDLNAIYDQSPFLVAAAGEAVSTMTGSMFVRTTDLTLPGRNGLNFSLNRVYDTDSAQLFDIDSKKTPLAKNEAYESNLFQMGPGWRWEIPSVEKRNGATILHLPAGNSYQVDSYNRLIGYPWKDIVFKTLTTGYSYYSTKDYVTYSFNTKGRLTQIKDKLNNRIDFTYTADASGNDLLTKIENDIQNSITFQYSDTGILIRSGNRTVEYTFAKLDFLEAPQRKVLKSVKDPANRVTEYTYLPGDAWYKDSNMQTATTNPYALVTSVKHPTGAFSNYMYPTFPVTRNAGTSQNEVFPVEEASNEVLYDTGQSKVFNRKKFTYIGGPTRLLADGTFSTVVTDDLQGRKTTHQYKKDSLTNITFYKEISKKLELPDTLQTYSYTYDETKKTTLPLTTTKTVTSVTDATKTVSLTEKASYDDWGNMTQQVTPAGATTTSLYDTTTHLLKETVSYLKGGPPTTTVGNQYQRTVMTRNATTYAVDSVIVKDEKDATLREERYTRDTYGNILKKDVYNTGNKLISTNFVYPAENKYAYPSQQTVQVTDADGIGSTVIEKYEFDLSTAALRKYTDGAGNATGFEYDVLGRVTAAIYPDLSREELLYKDSENTIEKWTEDEQSQILKHSVNKWDPLGRKYESGYVDHGLYSGKPYDTTGTYFATAKFEYDSYGRKVVSEDAMGNRTNYAYDLLDRLSTVTYVDGAMENYLYDDLSMTRTGTDPDGYKTRQTYDKDGRTTKTEWVNGTGSEVLSEYTYDLVGNVLTKVDANASQTSYVYNALSELVGVTDALGKQTRYTYDKAGHLTEIRFPDDKTVTKQFNELGKLIKQTNENGEERKFYYDANQNLTREIDPKGQTSRYEYSPRNMLTKKAAGSEAISYAYDAAGRRTQMIDATGTTVYRYNPQDLLDVAELPDGKTISYQYDANGNRTVVKDPFDKNIYYRINPRNHLDAVSLDETFANAEVDYSYTKAGRLDVMKQGNGIETQYTYDQMKRVESVNQISPSGNTLNKFGYSYDDNRNVLSTTVNGLTDQYTYDKLDRLQTSSQYKETYSYDDRGNRQTLESEKEPGFADAAYEFDAWNQLVKATTADGKVVNYKYNGDGLLYERTEGEKTQRFYYDADKVIAEATVENGVALPKYRYIRGLNLSMRENTDGEKLYFSQNNHGDVVELRNKSGEVVNSYSYDVWGHPVVKNEQVENSFGFAGELWDDTVSLQYLRARWYDPSQGRFLSEDTYPGDLRNPSSLNLYAYVLQNPLRYLDPSGHVNVEQNEGGAGFRPGFEYDFLLNTPASLQIGRLSELWWEAHNRGDMTTADRYADEGQKIRMNACNYLPSGCADTTTKAHFERGGDGSFAAVGLYENGAILMVFSTGQVHHLLSKKIMEAINNHKNLSGKFFRNDPDFIYRAANAEAHRGYQEWHREYDKRVERWLNENPRATVDQFRSYLNNLHQEEWLRSRIPNVVIRPKGGNSH